MTRPRMWWAVAFLGLAVGCSDGPPPIQEAKKVGGDEDQKSGVDLAAGKAPETSDPAAAAIVAAAVKAHTGGQADKLKALKSVTMTRSGPVTSGGPQPVPTTWVMHAAWPDRFRVKAELANQQVITVAWSGTSGWLHNAVDGKRAQTANELRDFKIDVTGEWLSLLFPLIEPEAKFSPAQDRTVNGKPAAGVRVWHGSLSDAVMHFDKETKQLALITFDGRESGRKVTKEVQVVAMRSYAGVTLPEKTEVRSGGTVFAEWTMTTLEPQPAIDSKVFENP